MPIWITFVIIPASLFLAFIGYRLWKFRGNYKEEWAKIMIELHEAMASKR